MGEWHRGREEGKDFPSSRPRPADNSLYCLDYASLSVSQMRECGLPVSIAGLELDGQGGNPGVHGELKGCQFSENENAISYTFS